MLIITFFIIIAAIFIILFKLIKGPTIWDRLMALNIISIKSIMLITVYAVYKNDQILMDISITYSIIGFLTVTLLSRFILKGGRLK